MSSIAPHNSESVSKDKISPLFAFVYGGVECLFIVLFWILTEYGDEAKGGDLVATNSLEGLYPFFQDIHVMIFIGFGFLMTFLQQNGFSSVGFNMLLAAFAIQAHILIYAFIHNSWHSQWDQVIQIDISTIIAGDFAAGAVLITYGAVLGKVSPFQMLLVAFIEIFVYAFNEEIGISLGITDIGGSMVIHMFGAYFGMGLSVAMCIGNRIRDHKREASVYHSDLFAMIGTVFLWMYWPSFNGAFGASNTQHRVVVNTVLSLCGSCFSAFLVSNIVRGKKFDMVDIQNATLAGGVAMGTCADMLIQPGAALFIGVLGGAVSVLGYRYLQPALNNAIGFHDTCGVHNLHGLPSILGAVAGIIFAGTASVSSYGQQIETVFGKRPDRGGEDQAMNQFLFMLITLGISLASGLVTGLIVKNIAKVEQKDAFSDELFWEVPEEETPHYFSKHVSSTDLEMQVLTANGTDQKMNGLSNHENNDRVTNVLNRLVNRLNKSDGIQALESLLSHLEQMKHEDDDVETIALQ